MKRIDILKDVMKYLEYIDRLRGLGLQRRVTNDNSANKEIVSLNKEITEWLDEEV